MEKPTPQYRKVYEQLRKHIQTGVYKEGDILPSENELCAVNHVTRPTVRKALDILANEGFIKKHQGLGSVVRKKPRGIGILSIAGTTSAIGKENLETKVIVRPMVRQWPDRFVYEITETERESGCIYFERLRYVDNIPIFYDITYLPNINLPRFTSRNLKDVSLFDLLREHYNIEVKGGEQNIKAIASDDEIEKYLKVAPNQPILNLQRKMDTNRLNFHIYSILYCNTEKHSLYGEY